MKRLILCLTLALPMASASPASAEDAPDGPSLMERGAQMLLEGLLQELEPGLDALGEMTRELGPALDSFVAEMGPALRDLLGQVEDWSAYHPPEILDNGDIIIRRRTDPTPQPDSDGNGNTDGPIDL